MHRFGTLNTLVPGQNMEARQTNKVGWDENLIAILQRLILSQCSRLRRNNSKYATKIVGTQNRQGACVHGAQDQKQSIFNTFKPAQ